MSLKRGVHPHPGCTPMTLQMCIADECCDAEGCACFALQTERPWTLGEHPTAMKDALEMHIESLRKLTTKQLKERFRQVCDETSLASNHTHLLRRVAWKLQANASGGLNERATRRAWQLAINADPTLPLPEHVREELQQRNVTRDRDPRLPPADTTIERSYQGKRFVVLVLENGFEYNGKLYASLSSIAHQITGTRWNGFHFFGLKRPWNS